MMTLHFLRPYWLLALIPASWCIWKLYSNMHRNNAWNKVIDSHLFEYLVKNDHAVGISWPLIFIGFFWIIIIIALAGPSWSKKSLPVFLSESAKVILLDLSPSMLTEDIKPSRVDRAKYKILDILQNFPEGRTALAVFSSESYVVSPLTSDSHTISALVSQLSPQMMPVSGSDISVGLQKALQLLQQGNAPKGMILLITDSIPNYQDMKMAQKINEQGYKISVLAVGTLEATTTNALQQLANQGGGNFAEFTNDNEDIKKVMWGMKKNHLPLKQTEAAHRTTMIWKDQGRDFIFLLLPIMLLFFRRGWLDYLWG